MSGNDFKKLLADAKLPERTVPVCLRGDLTADHESAERDLEQALQAPGDSLAGNGAEAVAERIRALEVEMREHTHPFRLRALPRPRFRALLAAHPPRNTDGEPDELDAKLGVNRETFPGAMLRECLIDPRLDDAEWQQLLEVLTDRQWEDLTDAAWAVNRGEVDIPFSRAASRMNRATDAG